MQLPKYRLSDKSEKKDFIFNMYGSTAISMISVLLLMIVSHILGDEKAGVFTLAYSTAQMMYTVAMFETRTVQVTDAEGRFSFCDIAAFKIFTVILMLTASAAFVFIQGFSRQEIVLTMMIAVYMALLAVSDIFQGNLHLNGYLRIAGFSMGSQVILAAIGFFAVLLATKSMYPAIVAMIAAVLLWILFFDLPFANNFGPLKPHFDFKKQKMLLAATAPLFISVFINQFNLNTPKFAIKHYLTEVDQSHYGYLVMPAFIINLLSIFVFRPQLVPMSEKWMKKEYKSFYKTLVMLYGWIVGVAAAALVGGYFLGIPILNLLYHTELDEYRTMFEILLVGGAFSAGSSLSINMLAVIKKQKYALIAYFIAFAVAMTLPNILVKRYGFTGAAYSYLAVTAALFCALFSVFMICLRFAKKQQSEENEG